MKPRLIPISLFDLSKKTLLPTFCNAFYFVSSTSATEHVTNELLISLNDRCNVSFNHKENISNSKKTIGVNNNGNNKNNNCNYVANSITNNDGNLDSKLLTSSTINSLNSSAESKYEAALSSTLRTWNKVDYWCDLCVEPYNCWNEHVGKKEHVIQEHLYETLINLERRWDVLEVLSELPIWERRFDGYQLKKLNASVITETDTRSHFIPSPKPWHTVPYETMLKCSHSQERSKKQFSETKYAVSNHVMRKAEKMKRNKCLGTETASQVKESLADLNYPADSILNNFFRAYEGNTPTQRHVEIYACFCYLLTEGVIEITHRNFTSLYEQGSNVLHLHFLPMCAQVYPRVEAKEMSSVLQNSLSSLACAILFYICHMELLVSEELREWFAADKMINLTPDGKSSSIITKNNSCFNNWSKVPMTSASASASNKSLRRLTLVGADHKNYLSEQNNLMESSPSGEGNEMYDNESENQAGDDNNASELGEDNDDDDDDNEMMRLSENAFENRGGHHSTSSTISFSLRSSFVRVLLGSLRWAIDDDCDSTPIINGLKVAADSHYYVVASHVVHLILSELTFLKSAEFVNRIEKVLHRPEGLQEMRTNQHAHLSMLSRTSSRLQRVHTANKTSNSSSSSALSSALSSANTSCEQKHEILPVLSNWGIRQWMGSDAYFTTTFAKQNINKKVIKFGVNNTVESFIKDTVRCKSIDNDKRNSGKSTTSLTKQKETNSKIASTVDKRIQNKSKDALNSNVKTRPARFTNVPANQLQRRGLWLSIR